MLHPEEFISALQESGFSFFSGVPCSYLKSMISCVIDQCDYVMAANEGDAVAICGGAYMAGLTPVVLMQNSGLTNAISPLTSLNHIFQIPVLGFVSFRGEEHTHDEPQHELMGKITIPLLELMGIRWEFLSSDQKDAKEQLKKAAQCIERGQIFFFVVRKNTFEEYPNNQQLKDHSPQSEVHPKYQKKTTKSGEDELPLRIDVLKTIHSILDKNTVLITPTGYTSRELYEIEDLENTFYMFGSMGCAGSIGLGLSRGKPDKDIIVIDGDGALLMRLGSMSTIGFYEPENLLHILLDNNSYESTGGQETVSGRVNFIDIAQACGYTNSVYVHTLYELKDHITKWKNHKELTFMHLKIREGTRGKLGRPSIHPTRIRQRFMEFLNDKLAGNLEQTDYTRSGSIE
jgi:phosphonopyruvate decarboxylase